MCPLERGGAQSYHPGCLSSFLPTLFWIKLSKLVLITYYSLSVPSTLDSGSHDYESVVMRHAVCLILVNINSVLLHEVTFLFSVKPSGTRCYVDGSEEIGSDFKLKCEPKEGSLPLQYQWQKLSNSQKLPASLLAGTGDFAVVLCAFDLYLSLVRGVCVCIHIFKFPNTFPFLDSMRIIQCFIMTT